MRVSERERDREREKERERERERVDSKNVRSAGCNIPGAESSLPP